MDSILWIGILIGLMSAPAMGEVLDVYYNITPKVIIERNKVTVTCNGTCTNSTTCQSTPVVILSITRHNKRATCQVIDTGDNTSKEQVVELKVHYGPDSLEIVKSNGSTNATTINDEFKVTDGDPSSNPSILCERGDCSYCEISWSRPAQASPNTAKSLPILPSDRVYGKNDSGTYTCTAKNKVSNKTLKQSFKLIVQYKPVISSTWNNTMKILRFVAEGVPNKYPLYEIQHSINNMIIRRNISATIADGTAKIAFDNPNYQDSGDYECFVSNGIQGNVTKSHTITIEDKPVVVDWKQDYNVSKGDPLDINLYLYANPAHFQVELNYSGISNIPITTNTTTEDMIVEFHTKNARVNGKKVVAHIPEVLEEYFFTSIQVSISNSKGHEYKNLTLLPQGKPDVPEHFTLKEKKHNMVKFLLETGFYNGAPQTLVIQYKKAGNESKWITGPSKDMGEKKNNPTVLSIDNLTPENTYEFRAYAINMYGHSDYTSVVTETMEATPFPVLIVSVAVGSVFVIIIIIIVVCIVKKHHKGDMSAKTLPKNTELLNSMPMTSGNDYSVVPVSGSDINDDVSHTYQNTSMDQPTKPSSSTVAVDRDQNNVLVENKCMMKTFASQGSSSEPYENTDDTMAPYLELTGSGDMVEEAYVTMTTSAKGGMYTSEKRDNEIQDPSTGYLDMQSSKNLVEQTRRKHLKDEKHYANTSDIQINSYQKHTEANKPKGVNINTNDKSCMMDYENTPRKRGMYTIEKRDNEIQDPSTDYLDMQSTKDLVEQTRRKHLKDEKHYANTSDIQKHTKGVTISTNDNSCMMDYENTPRKMSPPSFQQPRKPSRNERESSKSISTFYKIQNTFIRNCQHA
ncbi:glomerular basement membrane development [Mactra antiquata]